MNDEVSRVMTDLIASISTSAWAKLSALIPKRHETRKRVSSGILVCMQVTENSGIQFIFLLHDADQYEFPLVVLLFQDPYFILLFDNTVFIYNLNKPRIGPIAIHTDVVIPVFQFGIPGLRG